MAEEQTKTGTTTVGVVCKDCIVMGADRRITAGTFIAGKDFQKIYPVAPKMVLTISGVVSDVQLVLKYLKAELKLKKIRTGRDATLKETANLISTWNYGLLRSQYAIGGFLLGGIDAESRGIFDISPDGALKINDKFVASGSGSVFAYGVFETNYKENMTEQEGIKLIVSALNAALQRDAASGNGIDVYVITKDGVKKALERTVDTGVSA